MEVLPPGQAANRIIPRAILGCGSTTRITRKVSNGSPISCEVSPAAAALGRFKTSRKFSDEMRDIRRQARELAENQETIGERFEENPGSQQLLLRQLKQNHFLSTLAGNR